MEKIFIHTNNKQNIGAVLSKFSFEKASGDKKVEVGFINVDNHPAFKVFAGKAYKRKGQKVIYDPNDLQSFTLSRFMPPELMNFQGRALVVDPDVFAIQDATPLLSLDMQGKAIAACRKKDAWDTSVMLLDCKKLKHWKIESTLKDLEEDRVDYADLMTLKREDASTILEIPRIWNHLDTLTDETKMIHMTNRLTQPWRTGLPIDFTINPLPKIFGIIPREPIHKLLGKYPTKYQPHPDINIEKYFFRLTKEALNTGTISTEDIRDEITKGNVRKDFLEKLAQEL
jgi:hypothetical protein